MKHGHAAVANDAAAPVTQFPWRGRDHDREAKLRSGAQPPHRLGAAPTLNHATLIYAAACLSNTPPPPHVRCHTSKSSGPLPGTLTAQRSEQDEHNNSSLLKPFNEVRTWSLSSLPVMSVPAEVASTCACTARAVFMTSRHCRAAPPAPPA